MALASFMIGLAMLLGGAELLVRGAGRLALALKVPVLVVALTVVAFGTSMPEIMVSVTAALDGNPDISMGNVNGSNIANIALVLGACAMVSPLAVGRDLMRREVPVVIAMQLVLLIMAWDGSLSQVDGAILLLMGLGYNTWLVKDAFAGRASVDLEDVEDLPESSDPVMNLALIVGGLTLLVGGGQFLVSGAVSIAQWWQIDDRIVGVTVVAIGTSLPELITSIVSAYRKEAEMAVGNALGSNILNMALALGIAAMIQPLNTASDQTWFDVLVATLVTLILVPIILRGRDVSRLEGSFLVGAYLIYMAMLGL